MSIEGAIWETAKSKIEEKQQSIPNTGLLKIKFENREYPYLIKYVKGKNWKQITFSKRNSTFSF